jgi:hypothetical protein
MTKMATPRKKLTGALALMAGVDCGVDNVRGAWRDGKLNDGEAIARLKQMRAAILAAVRD